MVAVSIRRVTDHVPATYGKRSHAEGMTAGNGDSNAALNPSVVAACEFGDSTGDIGSGGSVSKATVGHVLLQGSVVE